MTYLCQVKLRASSGLPADDIINTMHMDITGDPAQARAAFNLAIPDAYDDIANYLSILIASTGHEITYYDLDDPIPRQPVVSPFSWDFTNSLAAGRLPGEVSLVVSTRAAYASGEPPARRRNRFYLGPLATNTVDNTSFVDSTFQNLVADSFQTAFQAVNTAGDSEMVCYSPTDATARPMIQLWVNNEFDTQRRRGRRATNREQRGI